MRGGTAFWLDSFRFFKQKHQFPSFKLKCKCKFCKVCHYCCCVASASAVIDAVVEILVTNYVVVVAVGNGSGGGSFVLFY